MDITQKSHSKSVKALLRLYRKVLHNVNNEIVYLDELTYTTSRKHLSDLVNSLVEFETNIDSRKFNDKLDSCYKTFLLSCIYYKLWYGQSLSML